MSETVSKPRVSKLVYFALAVALIISGVYVASNSSFLKSWTFLTNSSVQETIVIQDESSQAERSKEYAAYKKVFLAKLDAYKAVLAEGDKAAAIQTLNGHMTRLAAIETEYVKIRPNATEPDRIKLKKLIGEFSSTLGKVNELNYQLVFIRDARFEVTNAHSILLLTSPKLYAEEKKEIKALLRSADQGTHNIYDSGQIIATIERLSQIALYRLKPEDQEATPEIILEAGLHAIEMYLNQATEMYKTEHKVSE